MSPTICSRKPSVVDIILRPSFCSRKRYWRVFRLSLPLKVPLALAASVIAKFLRYSRTALSSSISLSFLSRSAIISPSGPILAASSGDRSASFILAIRAELSESSATPGLAPNEKTRVLDRLGAKSIVMETLLRRRYSFLFGPLGLVSSIDVTNPASSMLSRCFATSCWLNPSSLESWSWYPGSSLRRRKIFRLTGFSTATRIESRSDCDNLLHPLGRGLPGHDDLRSLHGRHRVFACMLHAINAFQGRALAHQERQGTRLPAHRLFQLNFKRRLQFCHRILGPCSSPSSLDGEPKTPSSSP